MTPGPRDILDFWFKDVGEKRWFESDPKLDAALRVRFEQTWHAARDGKLSDWEETATGALALLIVLDQFPRNMFRGRAEAFSTDAPARAAADRALARGFDLEAPKGARIFFYLPFMHSENLADQDRCVALVRERLGEDSMNFPYAVAHRDWIRRFGRFPGRNAALGRVATPEETIFLAENKVP